MKERGFTLIELLVVVGIIVIIAMIALPNFLEAMVRSKVSRTKSDLRTISLALEAYCVDKNTYPPDSSFGIISYIERLKNLTTPVAYLSSVPGDPFADLGSIARHSAAKACNPYAIPATSGNIVYPLTYDFAYKKLPGGGYELSEVWARMSQSPNAVLWAMRGIGPDKWPDWLGEHAMPYDPTNGSVSSGNIFWTGPGKGDDQPLLQ